MGCISPQSPSSYFILEQEQSSKFENHPAHPNQEYWSLLDGDDHGTWVDARLTPLGESQACTARAAWQKQIERGVPAPQSYYVSPLNRCCRTAQITFEGMGLPLTMPFRPIVKEVCRFERYYRHRVGWYGRVDGLQLLRETMGLHTCDRRSRASDIAAEFAEYRFEAGFSEEDLLYDPEVRETNEERDQRLACLLEDIFVNDESIFISLTAHSGAITSILEVVGHRRFPLATGAMIPVVVKGVMKEA